MQNRAHTACQVYVFNKVIRSWSQLGDMRNTVSNFVDPLQRVIETGFLCESQRMKHGVGGAAHRHIQRKRVVDCFNGYDITRLEVHFDEFHQLFGGFLDEFFTLFGDGKNGTITRESKTQRFG